MALQGGAEAFDLYHQVVWQDISGPSRAFKGGEFTLSAAVLQAAAQGDPAWPELLDELDDLCGELATDALHRAWGPDRWQTGSAFSLAEWQEQGLVQPDQGRLFDRLCAMAVAQGYLAEKPVGWQILKAAPGAKDLQDRLSALSEQAPAFGRELTLLREAVAALPGVLAGQQEGVEVLFNNPAVSVEALYGDAPLAAAFNRLAGTLLTDVLSDKPVKVLEIGAGSGATTAALLSQLPSGSRYHFTDISQAFLDQAEVRFGDHREIDFSTAVFDVTQPAAPQVGQAGQQDLVVAANVLHATPDLKAALREAVDLLKPGGRLLLLEVTNRRRRFDLVFGLTPGWWAFEDQDLRPDHALLAPAAWRALLEELGLEVLALLPEDDTASLPDQSVILAAKPLTDDANEGPQTGTWLALGPDAKELVSADRSGRLTLLEDLESLSSLLEGSGTSAEGLLYVDGVSDSKDNNSNTLPVEFDSAIQVMKLLAQSDHGLPLWLLTQGAAPDAGDGDNPAGAAYWGLGRTFAHETPDSWGGLIDLDPAQPLSRQLGRLHKALKAGEDQILLRGDHCQAGRLQPWQPAVDQETEELDLSTAGTWIITGGLGGLGPALAERLAARGLKDLVLISRRGALSQEQRNKIEAQGGQPEVCHGDVSDDTFLTELLARLAAEGRKVTGVLHGAGQLDDGLIQNLSLERFQPVWASKAKAGQLLDRLTQDLPLTHFVIFSSAVSLLAPAGQATHATANTALAAVAARRRAAGLPAQVIHWGAWSDIGAAADKVEARAGQEGFAPITPEQGLAAFETLLKSGESSLMVLPANWHRYLARHPEDRQRSFFKDVARKESQGALPDELGLQEIAVVTGPSLRDDLAKLPRNRHEAKVRAAVRQVTAAVLGQSDAEQVPLREPLGNLGLDSLMAVQLRNALGDLVEEKLPAQLLFDYPTVAQLADHLLNAVLSLEEVRETAEDVEVTDENQGESGLLGDLDLSDLESLSDEDAAALLAEMTGQETEPDKEKDPVGGDA